MERGVSKSAYVLDASDDDIYVSIIAQTSGGNVTRKETRQRCAGQRCDKGGVLKS